MRKLLLALISLSAFIVLAVMFFAPPFSAQELDLNRLRVPAGFHVELFAKVPKARLMTFSPGGALLVTSTSDGNVYAIANGKPPVAILSDLNAPHGIAFYQGKLYVADTDEVLRFDWDESALKATNPQSVTKLSRGGMHFTRTLLFHDGKMYVASGSDCNVCKEEDPHRAAVTEYTPEGKELRIFASGLRNDVGLSENPVTHTLWGGDNGRDWLGDNLPPEEVNELVAGGNYGWPFCYGNKIPNPEFKAEGEKVCPSTIAPKVEMQAHMAPLGVTFYAGDKFPAEYRNGLFVALHGSWNRSALSGYKVDFIPFAANGQPSGPARDFVTGFILPGEAKNGARMGRPAGVAVGPDGALYVSDDTGGAVYRVTYGK